MSPSRKIFRDICLNVRVAFAGKVDGEDDVSPDAVAFHTEDDCLPFLSIGEKGFQGGDGLCVRHIAVKVFFYIVKALGGDALDNIAGF